MATGARAAAPPFNNIGLLRLLLASLVIVGHAPEILDGDRHREPLTLALHAISLGELAVDGFFLISGFLITASMCSSGSASVFLWRRLRRIAPGYVVAFLLCVAVFAPLLGVGFVAGWPRALGRLVLLRDPPPLTGVAPHTHVASINGAMWSISYEFRCYLTTLFLWWIGAFSRRRLFLIAVVGLEIAAVISLTPMGKAWLAPLDANRALEAAIGSVSQGLRLESIYLLGACAWLYEARVVKAARWPIAAVAAAAGVALTLAVPTMGEAWIVGFGAIVLTFLAFNANLGAIGRINRDWDISYGVYLYGWPVSLLVAGLAGVTSPLALAAITLPLALAVGAASWWGVEKWAKDIRFPYRAGLLIPRRR